MQSRTAFALSPSLWRYDEPSGRPKLSAEHIQAIAEGVLARYSPYCLSSGRPVEIQKVLQGVEARTGLSHSFLKLPEVDGDLRGITYFKDKRIVLDESLLQEQERNQYLRFTIAHELGHWILQRHRPIFLSPGDSTSELHDHIAELKCNATEDPKSVREWIEWQANHFGSCLVLPRRSVVTAMIEVNREAGLPPSKQTFIYFNASHSGRADARLLLMKIADRMGVSPRQVEIRLERLKLLTRQVSDTSRIPMFFPDLPY